MYLDSLLLHCSCVFLLAVLAACYLPELSGGRSVVASIMLPVGAHGVVWAIGVSGIGWSQVSAGPMAAAAAALAFTSGMPSFSVPGRFLIASQLTLSAVALVWGGQYVWSLEVSSITRALMLSTLPLMLVMLPFGILALIPQWEVLTRRRWSRPRTSVPARVRSHYPKVSLHVPICAEPPDVVLATLSALAALDYPNFEVLVIDNNTKDEALWRPVQRWCAADERFRFFHLEHCPGAKAGALNYVRQHMAEDATIVGLIDSDYQARPTFISALVGHFDDPHVGFVQTPHDYRDWQHSLYQRMCYWEYRSFFTICVPSWNERGAAITVGTMALIRRAALEEAGGWSEWCLTEDSELAPRIHALGYTSIYVQESFGRGLIPETFGGYAKQRRRWTYGPIQELKAHLPMLLPKGLGKETALSAGQKLFHLHHDLDPLFSGLGLLLMPIGFAITASMLIHDERATLSWAVIAAGACVALANTIMSWRVQCRAMQCSLVDVFCASIAKMALAHSIATSALRALAGVPLSWQRTDKFKARREGIGRALTDARVECLLGLLFVSLGVWGLASGAGGFLLLFVIGWLLQGLAYLMAPLVALLAERDLHQAVVLDSAESDVEAAA